MMPNEDKWYISGPLGIGALEPAGKLDVQGDIRAGNSDIYFTKTDHEHSGIGNTAGYAAIENASNFDALMILGRAGTDKGRKVRLWDYLEVNGPLVVQSEIRAGNSDIYFTKTDHTHSGVGNTVGHAAIENASDLDALAILGRAGTDKGRKVRLWDYLEVVGPLVVQADIQAGNSDIYFTKTDHAHSGVGNTAGHAAIENASDLDALAILGRAGTDKGRKVRLWDYLEVNGPLDVTGDLTIGSGKTISSPGRLHISGDENLFLLNKGGVIVSKARQGNGNLTVEGNFNWGGDKSDSSFIILGNLQISWGTISFPIPNLNNSQDVAFPHSFGKSPSVLISLNDPGAHPQVDREQSLTCGVGARGVTVSGFKAVCKTSKNEDKRQILCAWVAIGKA